VEKKEKEGLNHVVGRILLNTGLEYNSNPEHIIEQVWSINHRDIERYHVMLKINYIRASRNGWNRRYNLDCVSIANEDNKKVMLDDFISVVKNIENNEEKQWLFFLTKFCDVECAHCFFRSKRRKKVENIKEYELSHKQ